jgi:Domain of unknown function (DUF4129)
MSRDWTHIAGVPIDTLGFGLLLLLALAGAMLLGAAWHFFPRWLPRRSWFVPPAGFWRRLRDWRWSDVRKLWQWRWRRRERDRAPASATTVAPVAADRLPDLPAAQLLSLADQHAAAGRFREAVRERLRAITRQLVDRGLITHHPEWTITELVRAAGAQAPSMRDDLQEASRIFSDIWYGERPATRTHDDRMRELAAQVDAASARAYDVAGRVAQPSAVGATA